MGLILLSLAAGAFTVLSPCILPVLPFVFARRGSAALFGGLGLGFAGVLALATVAGGWAADVHGMGRALALGLLMACGLFMAFPVVAQRVLRPLQSLAVHIDAARIGRPAADWMLGLSTGLLWAPCAGPVLGVVLTGATLQGNGQPPVLPLMAYAAGAAGMLAALRLLIGRTARRLPPGTWRTAQLAGASGRLAGGAVLAGALLVASGLLERIAVELPNLGLDRFEEQWLETTMPAREPPVLDATPSRAGGLLRTAAPAPSVLPMLPVMGPMPSLDGATAWLQSAPIRSADLRGRVVLVDFWTFGCINCQRALPAVRDWARRYRDEGLVVIGVHAPEFAFERDRRNVERAVQRLQLDFPVAMDNTFAIWNAWSNHYWPALYLVDAQGRVRWRHIGEGAYPETEQAIRQLLDEARHPAPGT